MEITAKCIDKNYEATISSLATLIVALYLSAQVLATVLIKKWNVEADAIQGSHPKRMSAPTLQAITR